MKAQRGSRGIALPLVQEARWAQGWSVTVQKISPPLEFDPHPIARHYTDYDILAHMTKL